MSPQNRLCRSERNPAPDTLALNSLLSHFNGDNAYSPQIPDTKLTVTSKVQFLQLQHVFRQICKKHNPSHVRRHTLPPQHLITPFRLNTHNPFTSLAAPKANPMFHAANKNLFTKTHFDSRHLTSSSSSFYFSQPSKGNYTLSEETTQRKHTYVTSSSSLLTNQLLQLKSSYTKTLAKTALQCLIVWGLKVRG